MKVLSPPPYTRGPVSFRSSCHPIVTPCAPTPREQNRKTDSKFKFDRIRYSIDRKTSKQAMEHNRYVRFFLDFFPNKNNCRFRLFVFIDWCHLSVIIGLLEIVPRDSDNRSRFRKYIKSTQEMCFKNSALNCIINYNY